jgi:predicted nucleic acid-binding protein
VLAYPKIVPRLAFYQLTAADVLQQFDRLARLEPAAPKAPLSCSDADDQKFIDLALAHQTVLLSKDRAVLRMKKRLAARGVQVQTQCPALPTGSRAE